MPTGAMTAAPATAHGHGTLAVVSVAQFLIALDYSIIYIALPSIAADLGLDPALAQWVVSAYGVLFAGFLVLGGRLADRLGARRLFVLAVTAFGLAGVAGGAAGDGALLLAARAGQGLGAALLQPAVLALIGTTFPAGPERGRALAVWGSVGASGLAAGAVLGGLLTTASWRLTFFVNAPVVLLCVLGAVLWAAPARDHAPGGRVPVTAAALGTGAVLTLVLGLTLAADHGWGSPATLGALALALALLTGFIRNERATHDGPAERTPDEHTSRDVPDGRTPRGVLIEPVLRRIPSLRIGAAATALYMASVGSEFYLLTLLLQTAEGHTPLQAGLAFLPLALMVTAGNTAAGRAVRRARPAAVLLCGFAAAAAGLLWIALSLHGGSYAADLLPGILLSGFGHGVIYSAMFILGTRDVPAAHQGTAGALLTTSQYLAGALTLAVLTLVLGPSPGHAEFRAAFLVTATAAGAGLLLAVTRPSSPEVAEGDTVRTG
ncbi:MFS transporter [Planomonospora corallina]|uniref:MFS transporter n=1 Tax=Planomonospora corallina TaxID=1806052 RepID=A0ABV8I3Z4_9ACTN